MIAKRGRITSGGCGDFCLGVWEGEFSFSGITVYGLWLFVCRITHRLDWNLGWEDLGRQGFGIYTGGFLGFVLGALPSSGLESHLYG